MALLPISSRPRNRGACPGIRSPLRGAYRQEAVSEHRGPRFARRVNYLPPQEARPVPSGSCRCTVARSFTAKNARAMAERNAPSARLPAARHCPAANTKNAATKSTGIHDPADRRRRSSANQTAGSNRTRTSMRRRNIATDQPFVIADSLNLPRTAAVENKCDVPVPLPTTLLRVRYDDANRTALAGRRQGAAPPPADLGSGASANSASATT
jgi:hypothetical protein